MSVSVQQCSPSKPLLPGSVRSTSRRRGGNAGDTTGKTITNNASAASARLLACLTRQRGKEIESNSSQARGESGGRGEGKNAVDYNQSGTTEFALGGAESMGPILGRLIPLPCCICERLIHQCMWMTFAVHMENTSTSPRRGSMQRRRKSR